MQLATVSLEMLTDRVNRLLGTSHSTTYISQVRNGKTGSAALRRVTKDEVAKMLTEAAEAAKQAA